MLIAIIVIILYLLVIIATIVGIGYFIFKRIKEKKEEQDILNRDDY